MGCPWSGLPGAKLFAAPTGELWLLYTAQHAGDQDTAVVRSRISTDNGKTWRYSLPITGGPSSYSVLTEMPDGDYAIVYYGQRELVFQRFALDQLTGPLPVKPKTA